jgi:predicted O-methyltransferase YrrM
MGYWSKRIPYLIKHGQLFKELKTHLRHKNKKAEIKEILPLMDIAEFAGPEMPDLIDNTFEDGNVSVTELECIARIARNQQPMRVFEIGTFNGRTALNIARNIPDNAHVFTLDLPQSEVASTQLRIKTGERKFINKEISGRMFHGTDQEKKITQILSDSAKYDYSALNNTVDLVFVDGSHSYEYVINDTEVAMKLLRNGKGIIIWHDYGWREVIQALNEYYQNDPRFKDMKHIRGTSMAVLRVG